MATFRTSQPDSAADQSLLHIVLVGLPGSGKSTTGRLLAHGLGRTFLDFDDEITRREGMSIAEIFASQGEPRFRQLEHSLTLELLEFGNMVLAPGGGWIGQPATVALLRAHAKLVYLKMFPAAALRRMGNSHTRRPLLQRPDPLAEMERLYQARRTAYESADVVVDVERITPHQVVARIVAALSVG